jgi:hypothetical protein
MFDMRRRDFITLFGGAAAAWPFAARAQHAGKLCQPSVFWVPTRFRSRADGPPHSYSVCANIGVVNSLARPGGNITGLSNQFTDAAGKRVELLRDVVGELRRLAILANVGIANAVLEIDEIQAAGRTLGLEGRHVRHPPSRGYCARFHGPQRSRSGPLRL